MGVVTWTYYSEIWLGEAHEADFPRLELLAETLIQAATRGADYAALHPAQQEAYQRAVCAQIDYLNLNGAQAAYDGGSTGGWTVGKVSVTGRGGSGDASERAQLSLSPLAVSILSAAGLLYRGVLTLNDWWGWLLC